MNIELKILDKRFYSGCGARPETLIPTYSTEGSVAIDLVCTKDVYINPGEVIMIGTGLAIHIGSHDIQNQVYCAPVYNYAALIIPRSGLGTKGLVLGNSVGVIDEYFQGEVLVSAWNRLSDDDSTTNIIHLPAWTRFAQLMFVSVVKPAFRIVDEFSNKTKRGVGGFGSTGE
jgi:dUTP pyrophosphatase